MPRLLRKAYAVLVRKHIHHIHWELHIVCRNIHGLRPKLANTLTCFDWDRIGRSIAISKEVHARKITF